MYRVFLIDDETWAMVSLEHLIDWQSLGFEIAAKIDNARSAWEQIQAEKPDVIITDIRMPGLSGLELLGRIREAALPVEVVLVSAFADFSYAQEAIRQGAFEYLLKPVRRDKLGECIRQLGEKLEKKNLQRSQEDEVRRRTLFRRCSTAREAYRVLGGEKEGEIALLLGGPELAACLRRHTPAAAWPQVALPSNEYLALIPWKDDLPAQALALCSPDGSIGVYGLAQGDLPLDALLFQARNAWRSARFAGLVGTVSRAGLTGYAQEADLFKALQYNQKAMVLTHLDAIRRDVESGTLLLDKLFALLLNLDSFWRHTQGQPSLFAFEWKQFTDLLRDYPTCDSLFDRLIAAFSDDGDEALLSPILQEIEMHYAHNRTLADLGQELGVSQAHLSQLIRRSTGKTYSELVQEKRMDKARELLAYSDKAVMDIAIEVGYSDQFYFSKLFKRLWGMSPNAWRKHMRSGNQITKKEMK